ncbi:6-bladed beta-propeller [Fodinibius salsisoli]|uniref:6-bladed beta-propeller n=1 Tax=Fodinibius salsisoli TaxID=2820877 RepID=A0ABT3PQQ0_9BACT|nr:6-bladed beta-propeller [Fodinibius salsisoli]MCW9708197.1 6-bladed beta-propeller [Fodinibius salsisoli]
MMQTTTRTFIIFIITFMTIQCTEDHSVSEEDITVTQELSIGTDSLDVKDHEIFSFIVDIVTDQKNRMYVADAREFRVRVYDEEGSFERYIGKEGSGPGEFQDISTLFINQRKQLVVLDPEQNRVGVFSLEGKFLSMHNLPLTGVRKIKQMPDGRYILLGYHEKKLIHIVDSSFSSIETSLGPVSSILSTGNRLEEMWVRYQPGSILVLAQDVILFSPSIYTGSLYKYVLKNNQQWQVADTIKGYSRHDNPVTFSSYSQAERVDAPFRLPEGRFAAQFHARSSGLFWNGQDTFMHFTIQERSSDDGLDFIAKKFSREGEPLYYSVLDSIQPPNKIIHEVNGNSVYLFDREETPLLRVLRME